MNYCSKPVCATVLLLVFFITSILCSNTAFGFVTCTWQYHFGLLDGTDEQLCLSSYEVRSYTEEKISAVVVSRKPARATANIPGICLSEIPCNFPRDSRDSSLTHYREVQLAVSGTVSSTAKLSLGGTLLELVEAEFSGTLQVTAQGTIEVHERTTTSDSLHLEQADCHNKSYSFWKTTRRVEGTVTEGEEYVWTLAELYFQEAGEGDPPIAVLCPPGPVTTRCPLQTASGSASLETALEVELSIVPCCQSLDSTPPCCRRVCEQ